MTPSTGAGPRAPAPVSTTERAPTRPATAGLRAADAARLLVEVGPNTLPPPRRPPPWRHLVAQLTHFFALLLWVAAGLALLAGMPQLGVAIAVVVVVNGVFAFVQERGAERAAERLADLLPRRALVRRDGQPLEVDAADLVPGDVVLLGPGDAVSADGTVAVAHACFVDTSTLTGESVPSSVGAGDPMLAGTFVTDGEAEMIVDRTGAATRLAGIARLTTPPVGDSPLAHQLRRVVRTVAVVAVAVGVGFFAVALLVGTPATDGFLFAVGVTVALVPEGLLPTVTVSLAVGAQRMAASNALVRRLDAVASLGSTTFICTDKTGTLTRNEMAVVTAWTPAGAVDVHGDGYRPDRATVTGPDAAVEALTAAAAAARACSNGRVVERDGRWQAQGDPMEAAIDALARRLGAAAPGPERRRFPFDPRRRRMSVVAGDTVLVKGAPDAVLPRCGGDQAVADAAVHALAERGLRTLAVARRTLPGGRSADPRPDGAGGPGAAASPGQAPLPLTADEAERDLELLAVLGLEDPPRDEAADAIAACRAAGIRVAMLTGDHPATARAVAEEVGLWRPGAPLLVGTELPDDDAVLGALVDRDGAVVARVSPEDKLRIARILRARGHVLAMTGDGVNDGPALAEADIGVAMGASGTDVARQAADLVLLDDDFGTIVEAVVHGRATFANLRRFLTYHLTDNVAELTPFVVWALSGGRFPLAIGVLQVLALDIGTDLLPALALGAERPAPTVLDRPPWSGRLLDRVVLRRAFGVLGPVEALVSMSAFVTGLVGAGWRPGLAAPTGAVLASSSGAAFTAVVVGQMANALACRSSTFTPRRLGLRTNRLLLGAIAAELGALGAFLFVPPVADALDHAPPHGWPLVVALAAAPAVLLADALDKRLRHPGRRTLDPGAADPATGR